MSMPPGEAGPYLIHFTGSKEHNVKLRAIARDKGWSLSEYGLPADRRGRRAADRRRRRAAGRSRPRRRRTRSSTSPFIEPELREDTGEIEAARAGRLPRLVTQADLRGDCHTHSEWSDGVHPIEVMAEACRRRGYAYQVLTDHTQSLAIARGLAPDRVEQQRAIIAALNARFEQEERDGTAPPETPPEGFRLLHGCELEVRADGALDYRRRAARAVRRRRRVRPRLAPPAEGGADPADAERDPQPPRRHRRPPVGADDPDPRRPRPRLGRGVRGRGRDRAPRSR